MLKDDVVKDIVMSQFEALRNNMRSADPANNITPNIRLTELITFRVKDGRLKAFKNRSRSSKRYMEIRRKKNLKLKPPLDAFGRKIKLNKSV